MVAVGYPGNKGQPTLKGMRLAPRSLRSITTTSRDCRLFMTISIKQKEVSSLRLQCSGLAAFWS